YQDWNLGADALPDLDKYMPEIDEQRQAHVVLGNISTESRNRLKKQSDSFPGLELRPGKHRPYPYNDSACHVIGSMAMASAQDMTHDPSSKDDLRHYLNTDSIGVAGIEMLCESALRGQRGRIEKNLGHEEIVSTTPARPGADVMVT